jgi:hypothetical protein
MKQHVYTESATSRAVRVREGMVMKTSGKGSAAKRSGTRRGSDRTGHSLSRVRISAGGRRAGTVPENDVKRTLTLWRNVDAKMKLHDLNLHLQGLYAELGKSVYELRGKKPRAGSMRSRELEDIFGKIKREK